MQNDEGDLNRWKSKWEVFVQGKRKQSKILIKTKKRKEEKKEGGLGGGDVDPT